MLELLRSRWLRCRLIGNGSRYTDEQIAFALKQAETGTPVAEVIRRMGISEQTFYRWKKVYGGLGVGELRRLKQLEDENRQLKQLVADLSLDKHILQDVLSKSSEGWTTTRARRVRSGVPCVNNFGGITTQYEVELDPAQIQRFGLSLKSVEDAITANNRSTGGSVITRGEQGYVVRGVGALHISPISAVSSSRRKADRRFWCATSARCG